MEMMMETRHLAHRPNLFLHQKLITDTFHGDHHYTLASSNKYKFLVRIIITKIVEECASRGEGGGGSLDIGKVLIILSHFNLMFQLELCYFGLPLAFCLLFCFLPNSTNLGLAPLA